MNTIEIKDVAEKLQLVKTDIHIALSFVAGCSIWKTKIYSIYLTDYELRFDELSGAPIETANALKHHGHVYLVCYRAYQVLSSCVLNDPDLFNATLDEFSERVYGKKPINKGDKITNKEKAQNLLDSKKLSMRSCWECNPSHEHLKTVGGLFFCFDCGRYFMNGGYFDDEEHCRKPFVQLPEQEFVKITKEGKK